MGSKHFVMVIGAALLAGAACTGARDVGSASSAVSACWDPGFSLDSCDQSDWWMEFAVSDTSTTDIQVTDGTRTIDLSSSVDLGDGNVKFGGGPDDAPVPAGTMIRVTATNGQETATSDWFPYQNATPTLDCSDASDAGADAGPEACTPACGGRVCGDDGCGGSCGTCGAGTTCSDGTCVSGCVSPWNPTWQETQYAGEYWVEYVVQGGGSLPVAVTLEVSGGASYPMSYAYGKWTTGVDYLASGTTVVLHATDATGATAKTAPFQYLVDQAPATDPCGGTPSTSPSCVPLARGMLTITMDDSYPSQDTLAKPVLDKYGFKATIYDIERQLEDYGDLPYAQDLAADGMEVGSHTVTHPDLTTLSVSDVDYELSHSQQYLAANVGSPVVSFATPMGSYDATVLGEIEKFYGSHRTVNPGLNYMGSDVFQLNSDGAYGNVSPSTICSWLQNAASLRGWEILMFHDFTTDAQSNADLLYPIADFDAILQCAKNTPGLDVVTTTQGANAIRCASPP